MTQIPLSLFPPAHSAGGPGQYPLLRGPPRYLRADDQRQSHLLHYLRVCPGRLYGGEGPAGGGGPWGEGRGKGEGSKWGCSRVHRRWYFFLKNVTIPIILIKRVTHTSDSNSIYGAKWQRQQLFQKVLLSTLCTVSATPVPISQKKKLRLRVPTTFVREPSSEADGLTLF